jgi:hypothetical protein
MPIVIVETSYWIFSELSQKWVSCGLFPSPVRARWWCILKAHRGVVRSQAANQRKAKESSTKTKEDISPWWWRLAWQGSFIITLVTWGIERGEGPWNSEQKSIGGAHVSCLFVYPLHRTPHPYCLSSVSERVLLLCVCVCVFFICMCTLFVWRNKESRSGSAGQAASVCVLPLLRAQRNSTMLWGKVFYTVHRQCSITHTCSSVTVSTNSLAISRNTLHIYTTPSRWVDIAVLKETPLLVSLVHDWLIRHECLSCLATGVAGLRTNCLDTKP